MLLSEIEPINIVANFKHVKVFVDPVLEEAQHAVRVLLGC